jgi:hypothetical protein
VAVQEFTVTGDGAEDLGGYIDIWGIAYDMTVKGILCQDRSAGDPRRLMHTGWLALGYEFGAGPELAVFWHKYIEFEREATYFATLQTAHHLVWHMDPGNEAHIAVFY